MVIKSQEWRIKEEEKKKDPQNQIPKHLREVGGGFMFGNACKN